MLESSKQLIEIRDWAVRQHRDWKLRSRTSDLMVAGRWSVIWPDLSYSEVDPLVENIYVEALEDKAAAAAAVTPFVECAPTRGTRGDDAEKNAQRRRRIFISMMRDSLLEEKQQAWYFDWYQHGAQYSVPWVNWGDDERHPFLIRMDPRHAYPLTHNSNDELSSVLFIKYRRLIDLEQDRTAAPAVGYLTARMEAAGRKRPDTVEEIWYMDDRQWGLAYCASMDSNEGWRYVSPMSASTANTAVVAWAVNPHDHGLSGCPAIEKARRTPDGEYRGAIDVMIPNLKVAHNLMARLMEDVERQIYAPDIIENVEDLDEFRPGGLLVGTGAGARYQSTRKPINYEAIQHVGQQLASARNAAAFPQQRSGEFDASIASAKAVTAVMGGYGVQQAWSQRDMALFYRRSLSRLAEFDEQWCGGKKEITGWDEGELFAEKYDPATFWKGDYRLEVGFHNIGLDDQQHLTKLAVAKNMGGLSRRSFMRKSGMVDNPLTEETEIALEVVSDSLLAFMFKQADQGNLDPAIKFTQRIDADKQTVRQASLDVIREMYAVPEGGAAAQPGMPGQGNPAAAMLQQRSLEQGGVPGQAAGMPQVSPQLLAMLPKGPRQAMAEQTPGGSGP